MNRKPIQPNLDKKEHYLSFLRSRFLAPNVMGISDRWLLKSFDTPENKQEFFNENNRRTRK